MVRIYIEISGGVLQAVNSTEDIEYCLVDHDNIRAGDIDSWTNIYSPDLIDTADNIELNYMNQGLKK